MTGMWRGLGQELPATSRHHGSPPIADLCPSDDCCRGIADGNDLGRHRATGTETQDVVIPPLVIRTRNGPC